DRERVQNEIYFERRRRRRQFEQWAGVNRDLRPGLSDGFSQVRASEFGVLLGLNQLGSRGGQFGPRARSVNARAQLIFDQRANGSGQRLSAFDAGLRGFDSLFGGEQCQKGVSRGGAHVQPCYVFIRGRLPVDRPSQFDVGFAQTEIE